MVNCFMIKQVGFYCAFIDIIPSSYMIDGKQVVIDCLSACRVKHRDLVLRVNVFNFQAALETRHLTV